jgi:hypothetical protein
MELTATTSRKLKFAGATTGSWKRDPKQLWDCPQSFLATALRDEPAHLIGRLDLADLSLDATKIEPLVDQPGVFRMGACRLRPIQFRRFVGNRPLGSFRIDFDCKVCGPIALGHSAHFGPGLFVPTD